MLSVVSLVREEVPSCGEHEPSKVECELVHIVRRLAEGTRAWGLAGIFGSWRGRSVLGGGRGRLGFRLGMIVIVLIVFISVIAVVVIAAE